MAKNTRTRHAHREDVTTTRQPRPRLRRTGTRQGAVRRAILEG